jgi:hypothetical protein
LAVVILVVVALDVLADRAAGFRTGRGAIDWSRSSSSALTIPGHRAGRGGKRGAVPRTLTIFFPDGTTEHWLTKLVLKPGTTLIRNGVVWTVTDIGVPERHGERRHTTITVRPIDES